MQIPTSRFQANTGPFQSLVHTTQELPVVAGTGLMNHIHTNSQDIRSSDTCYLFNECIRSISSIEIEQSGVQDVLLTQYAIQIFQRPDWAVQSPSHTDYQSVNLIMFR